MSNPTTIPAFIDELIAISGVEHLRTEENGYSIAPASTDEIAAILHSAGKNGFAVSPYGGGTKQSWGNRIKPALTLHTHRLSTVKEHTWQDMTCTVEAGCPWSSMQLSLEKHGQFVALDPLWPRQATIGGVVATNDSGSLRLKYGSLRDLVIGMTIVLADGTIARSGGKVVKNVAGYDLHKLMTGAYGTLGIITEITFRLHSIPRHVRSFTIASPNVEPLGQLLAQLLDSHLSMQSLQLRSGQAGFNLDLKVATLPEVIEEQASSLARLADRLQLQIFASRSDVWEERQRLFDEHETLLIKATMLPSDTPHFTAVVRDMGGTSVAQAVGIMIASLPITVAGKIASLRERVEGAHGSLAILHNPTNDTTPASSTPSDTLPLMRELKHRFDPNGILNPGRFLGGI